MKVIILDTNKVKEVAVGYAANYLIPKGLAVIADEKNLQKLKSNQLAAESLQKKQQEQNIQLAKKFQNKKVTVKVKAGKKGKLFGTITKKELGKILNLDKHNIELPQPIKKLGEYKIDLKFGSQKIKVTVIVEAENGNPKKQK